MISSLVWAVSMAQHLEDLGSFLHSGVAYRQGLDPYGYYGWLHPQPIAPDALNLNPPVSVYPFALLSFFNSEAVRWIFLVGNTLVFGLTLAILAYAYPQKRSFIVILALFSTAGLWHMLGYLQIYAPLLLLVTGSWLAMRRGDLLMAGIMAGIVVAIKPNFVLWPVFLIAAGHRRTGVSALATFGLVSLIPLAVDGPGMYWSWFHLTSSFSGLQWASNSSIASMTARFGSQSLGFVIVGGLVVWLVWWLRQNRTDLHSATTLGILAALLFGPASWAGYTLFLLPFLFSRSWNRPIWAGVLMLATPFWLVRTATAQGSIWDPLVGPLYGWAVLLLLGTVLYESGVRLRFTE
ncbi:MAG TPA: glycosyltransferase family 87 protein, partial [Dehalococcoidia bacterium]|nr:glycosyltransferase family 87 protein [Dehalococcoidia bacterium]